MARVLVKRYALSLVVIAAPATFHVSSSRATTTTESLSWWSAGDKDISHFNKFINRSKTHVATNDGTAMMLWPSLQEGLQHRATDEIAIQKLISKLMKNPVNADEKERLKLSNSISEILYGTGCTVAERQNFLEQHGCVRATPSALAMIHDALRVQEGTVTRGVVEVGVGFGQWARQLIDTYDIDIVAFDNMASLPLDPRLHHTNTKAYQQYFYQGKVRYGDDKIFQNNQLKTLYQLDGRALMIIFPDPGPMALQCLNSYISSSGLNDMLIYVGEGRGGANANDAFFDELERVDENGAPKWDLVDTCKLQPFGEKGFERMFVFRKTSRFIEQD